MENEPKKILEKSRPGTSLLDFRREEVVAFLRDRLRDRQVLHAFLFGSMVAGGAGAWSDIDLIVVQETTLPFIERAREFSDLFDLGVPVDVLVYTPDEFAELRAGDSGFWQEFNRSHLRLF